MVPSLDQTTSSLAFLRMTRPSSMTWSWVAPRFHVPALHSTWPG